MYINYLSDRKNLGFMALQDIEAGNQVDIILKIGGVWFVITFSVINEQDLGHRLYSDRPTHERISNEFQSLEDFRNSGRNGVAVMIPSGNGSDEKVILIKTMEYYLV